MKSEDFAIILKSVYDDVDLGESMNKKFFAAMFTLTGTIIGAGILGLPYVFAQSGLLVGLFWLVAIGAIIVFVNLAMGEITLRTKGRHQLPGYANKYLGIWGKRAMFFAMSIGIYSALLAYLIGEGSSFAKLIPIGVPPVFYGILFWLVMTLLLNKGMNGLKRVETWGVIGIIVIVVGVFIRYLPDVRVPNLVSVNTGNFFLPIGVVLFAMLGFTSIPELRKEIKGREGLFKKAIIFGSLIPVALYILFSIIIIGKLGVGVNEVATLSFGPVITILGIFTMLTSFFVLSFSLHDMFKFDMKLSRWQNFLFTSLIPLVAYVFIELFNLVSFNAILGIGGTISGGFTGILILLMARKAKKNRHNPYPRIRVPINWPIIILLSIVFLAAIVVQLVF